MDVNYEMYNVAIYIDYENIYKTLLKEKKNLLREGFFESISKWCKDNNLRIVKIVAYCNFDNEDLYKSYHQTILQEYGVNTVHTSNRGKNYADLQISIDAINDMYLNSNIDEFIIMSNDKDMSPLLNTIKSNKKKAILLTVGETYDYALCNVPDEHITLESILEKVDESKLYIHHIEDKVHENIQMYVREQLNLFSRKEEFKKFELNYAVENQVKYKHIMEYEMYHIFQILYQCKRIFIYQYDFRGKTFYGVACEEQKQEMLDLGIIQQEDIDHNFDFDFYINRSYECYNHKYASY